MTSPSYYYSFKKATGVIKRNSLCYARKYFSVKSSRLCSYYSKHYNRKYSVYPLQTSGSIHSSYPFKLFNCRRKYSVFTDCISGTCTTLVTIHNMVNLPWWGVIVLCTLLLRPFLTFPLAIYQEIIFKRLCTLKKEMRDWKFTILFQARFLSLLSGPNSAEAADNGRRLASSLGIYKYKSLLKKRKASPLRLLALTWVQIPVWVGVSLVSFVSIFTNFFERV
jgi:hypothetical protein